MERVGTCTLLTSKSRSRNKEYVKYMVWLPKEVGNKFQRGTKFNVYLNGDGEIILSTNRKVQLKQELYEALLQLFIRAFKDPTLNALLKSKFPENVGLILHILKRMKEVEGNE